MSVFALASTVVATRVIGAVRGLAGAPDTTTPTTTVPDGAPPTTTVETTETTTTTTTIVESPAGNVGDVVSGLWDALTSNGYQTGTAVIVATIALVALINLDTNRVAIAAVSLGAFWFGWLAWNTFNQTDNQLFPGDVQATKLWDIAFTSDIGFLVVTLVSCVIAAFVWRNGVNKASRVIMLIGGVLGASLIYNLYESVAATTNA